MLKSNTIFLHQGGEITHNYYLHSGIIKVYNDEQGENISINLLSGKMLLPFDNFSNKTSFVNLKTMEDTTLYAISNVNYRKLQEYNPIFNKIVEQELHNLMRTMVNRTLILLGKGVAERLKIALKYYPCLQRLSDIEVGHFINASAKRVGEIKKDV